MRKERDASQSDDEEIDEVLPHIILDQDMRILNIDVTFDVNINSYDNP